jgi:hypothetical protein
MFHVSLASHILLIMLTDLNLHFTRLLFVGVFKNITPLKSESLLYLYNLSTSVFRKSIAVEI